MVNVYIGLLDWNFKEEFTDIYYKSKSFIINLDKLGSKHISLVQKLKTWNIQPSKIL